MSCLRSVSRGQYVSVVGRSPCARQCLSMLRACVWKYTGCVRGIEIGPTPVGACEHNQYAAHAETGLCVEYTSLQNIA